MRKTTRNLARSRGLGYETLETRQLLAAVTVGYNPNQQVLSLQGTNAGESVQVTQNSSGTFSITGLNGTTINGLTSFPAVKSLRANLGKGPDSLSFSGQSYTLTTPRPYFEIIVDAGGGQNNVTIDRFYGTGGIIINGGDHNDVLTVRNSVANALTINAGEGNNQVYVSNTDILGLASFTSTIGNDTVNISNLDVDVLSISTGSGDDSVSLNVLNGASQNKIQELSIDTAKGDDDVFVGSVKAKRAKINGGPGSDEIDFAFSDIKWLEVLRFEKIS